MNVREMIMRTNLHTDYYPQQKMKCGREISYVDHQFH